MSAAALLVTLAASCTLTAAGEVELSDNVIRVGDVADLACVALEARARVAQLTVAQLRSGQTISLRRDALAALLRRRAPMLAVEPGDDGAIEFSTPDMERSVGLCAYAARDLAAFAVMTEPDVVRAPCGSAPRTTLASYDRHTDLVRTTGAIGAGDKLGELAPLPVRAVEAGASLSLAATVGAVRVERRVQAAQDAASGGRLFVHGTDGPVFSIPFPDSQQ
jgi:hypothetical protein